MVHLQRAVDMHMSRFGNWKNYGISPTTILPLFLPYIANVTNQKKRTNCVFFFSTSSFVSNLVYLREIFASFDFDKSYNYIQQFI